ncbi:zinc knuckle [Cooperia oncophora]
MDTSTSMVIGFDHSMEDHREENATQALSDWNQLSVARISTAQLAGNSSATAHGSGGFERLPRHERWATAGMDRAIPSIVASILTTSSQSTMSGESTSVASYNMGAEPVSDNRVHDMFTVFREVFKAQSVANVTKYNGKNSLMEFLRALEIKFPPAVWTNADRRDILVNHLEGTALSIFKGLPPGVREGTYEGVVSALKAARRNPCEQLRNVREWEHLSKKSNESVVDFCCRMEDLSRRIHPSTEWDFIRGSKLYSCLQHWQNSYYMLEALDAPEGQVYEEVKKVATRLEKLQFDSASHPSSSYRGRFQKRDIERKEIESQKAFEKGAGQQTGSQLFARPLHKCYICDKEGHLAADCNNGETLGGISLSSELEGWCKTVRKRSNSTQPLAMGQPCTYDVKIFGIPVKALIDTGSVVSIIPVGLLKQARGQGVDLDSEARIVGDGKQRKLFDASGNAMSFLSEIVTEVTVIGASTACVHMHVQQSKDNTLLLEAGYFHKTSPNGHQNVGYATNSRSKNGLPPDTAFAEGRVVVAPGTVATVKIKGGTR